MEAIAFIQGKPVYLSNHAILRARLRQITLPDHVERVLYNGKIKHLGKRFIQIKAKSKKGSIICIGEDKGDCIIIRTIERGN